MNNSLLSRYSFWDESWEKYWAILSINVKNSTAYFSAMVIEFVSAFAKLLAYMLIYKAAFETYGAERFPGLGLNQVLWILAITQSIYISRDTMSEITESVKSGQIAVFLNKPFSYPLFQYFSFLGKSLFFTVIDLIIACVIAYILVGPIPVELMSIVVALPLVLGAITLIFVQSFMFGLVAFWIEDPNAFSRIYHKFDLVLGGRIIPILLFPEPLRSIAMLLPWSQQFYSVSKTVVLPDSGELLSFYGLQIFWILFFSAIAWFLFSKGVKNIVTNGG